MSETTGRSDVDTHVPYYRPPRSGPEWIRVPELSFLRVEGHGDPRLSQEYHDALEALFSVSYTLRFALRHDQGADFRVGPPETLWCSTDPDALAHGDLSECDWTALIGQPDLVTERHVASALATLARKPLPALGLVELVRFEEGLSAQLLHIGPYDAEGPSVARLHEFVHADGFAFDPGVQRHHEIYLGDPRRTDPDRLRTILRQPVVPLP